MLGALLHCFNFNQYEKPGYCGFSDKDVFVFYIIAQIIVINQNNSRICDIPKSTMKKKTAIKITVDSTINV